MATLGALSIKITGDLTQFNKDIASVSKTLNKQTAGLSTVARSMTTVGDSMVKGITLPILAVGAGLLKLGEQFDAAYDTIRVGTGKTGAALESLNNDFRAVAKVAPSAFADIGTAISGYSQKLGLSGKPLQDLSTQILNLSRLTKTDLNTNIDQSAKLFNNWKIATANQSKTLDMMYKASTLTGIGVDKLMTEVTSSGPILRAMGYDLETSTALIASFDKAGVDVGTTIAGMKKALVTMAKEGMGNPQEILATYIDRIKNAGSSIEATGIAAELFGARGGAAMAASIREGRLNLDDLVASLGDSTNAISEASKATMDWQEKLVLLKGNLALAVEPLASKVFESLGRMIEGVTPKIESLAKSFGNLTPEMQDSVIAWGILTAGAPLLISALGRTLTGVIALRNGIALLNAVTVGGGLGKLLTYLPQVALAAGLVTLKTDDLNKSFVGSEAVLKKLSETSIGVTRYFNANHFNDIADALSGGLNPKILALNDAYVKGTLSLEAYTRALSDQTGKATLADQWGAKHYEFLSSEQAVLDTITNGTYKLTAVTADNTNSTVEAIVAATDHENKIAALAAIYPKLSAAQLEEKLAMDEGTDSTEKQTKSVDDLRSAFNSLIDEIFGGLTTYNDFQEANWAVEAAQKALTEAVKKYGKGSQEAQKAQNDLDNANITAIETAFKLSTQIGATTDQQEEARKKAVELGLEYIKSGDIGIVQFEKLATQFGLSGADIIKYADDMGIKLDYETRTRILSIETTQANINIAHTKEFMAEITSKTAYIDVVTRYSTENPGNIAVGTVKKSYPAFGYAGGGIIGNIKSAAAGMITPPYDNGGILTMLHKNEVVLNAGQTKNLAEFIFGLAQSKNQSVGAEAGSPSYVINIAEMSVREEADIKKIANELSSMKQDKLAGMGIKNG